MRGHKGLKVINPLSGAVIFHTDKDKEVIAPTSAYTLQSLQITSPQVITSELACILRHVNIHEPENLCLIILFHVVKKQKNLIPFLISKLWKIDIFLKSTNLFLSVAAYYTNIVADEMTDFLLHCMLISDCKQCKGRPGDSIRGTCWFTWQ